MMERVAMIAMFVGIGGLVVGIVGATSAATTRRYLQRLAKELGDLKRGLGLVPGIPATIALPARPEPPAEPAEITEPAPPHDELALARTVEHPTVAAVVAVDVAPAAPAAPAPPPAPAPPRATFEERVALVWFTRIGALILLVGFGYFFKYATESGWIGPAGRLGVGAAVGLAVLAGAERARARTRPIFLHVVSGVGLGILYLVVWASHVLYGYASTPVAFAGFGAITLAGGALAVRGRAELVLVFSLVGGFLAPILLSAGSDAPLALFAYLILLAGLAFVASVRLDFRAAPWVAVGGTTVLAFGWLATRFAGNPVYATIASRWPALLGFAAITAQWLVVARAIERRGKDAATAGGLVLAAVTIVHAAPAVLLHDTPAGLAATIATLGAGGVALARADGRPLLAPITAGAGWLTLAIVAAHVRGGDPGFALAAAAWAAIQAGAVAWPIVVRRAPPTRLGLATLAIAALGLPVLTDGALRGAVIPALDGALVAALGVALLARRARWAATIVLAQGLGLLAIAIAIQFSAATTVMMLAGLAAVVVALAAMARDPAWLTGGVTLFGIVLGLLVPAEVERAHHAAIAVAAAATLAAGFAASRPRTSWFPTAARLLVIAGHATTLVLVLAEAARLVPDPQRLLMIDTLALAGYAAALLAIGFTAKNPLHRHLGLAVFAITLGKLALVDIWTLARVYQMLVLLGVGGLLVVAGFLYARLRDPAR